MSERNTLVRSLHDLGVAAWFGGSLMGAIGLNGAAAEAEKPEERLRLSSYGWAKWTPVQIAAIGAHAVGGLGLILSNRTRLQFQPGATPNTVIKLVLTVAAAGVTAYAGVLGAKINERQHEGTVGTTEPAPSASDELAAAQKQLQVVQWSIPALTGVLIVLGAAQGEQQRGAGGLLDAAIRPAESTEQCRGSSGGHREAGAAEGEVSAADASDSSESLDIWERIRYARDQALEAERTERKRISDADNAELQRAASTRLATRQAVREALDDILDEESDPEA